jgi:hypothetical protein
VTVSIAGSGDANLIDAFVERLRVEQLEQMGLLAAREPERAAPARVSTPRSWPDYQRCVQARR